MSDCMSIPPTTAHLWASRALVAGLGARKGLGMTPFANNCDHQDYMTI